MTDHAPAPRSGTAQVIVNIIRNQHTPVFRQDYYNVTIGEYKQLRETVVITTATDLDPSSVSVPPKCDLNLIVKLKITLGRDLKRMPTFRPASMGIDPALDVCDLTQILSFRYFSAK